MIHRDQVIKWLQAASVVLEHNKDYLTELDSPIGDADHGLNMARGFQKVSSQLPSVQDKDIGAIFKATGMALITSVGGAAGPLYGTFFMDAAKVVPGKMDLTNQDLVQLFESGLNGIKRIGKANLADKTMLDALQPAVDALKAAVDNDLGVLEGLQRMVHAAEVGMRATIPLVARKGRASYVGERSAGHQDPGATSTYLILKALLETVETTAAD
jgi:dihydroxyacetone kinase-like protein